MAAWCSTSATLKRIFCSNVCRWTRLYSKQRVNMTSSRRLSKDGTKLVTTHKLSPFYFDRRGVPNIWTLAHLISYSRPEQSDVFYIPGLLETVAVFARYQEFYLYPEFYTKVKYNSSIEIVTGIGYVGKTSYICNGDVRLAKTQDILCRQSCQLIHVDISTRQPTALPQNRPSRKEKGPRPTFDSLPVLPDIPPMYSCKFRVRESDIDENGHTNQSVYVRLCSDTAAFGTKAGRYTSLSGDVLKYPVNKIAMLFQREALLGDMLEVQLWEILSKPVSLLFQVKRGEDDIVRCLFELYGQEKAKL